MSIFLSNLTQKVINLLERLPQIKKKRVNQKKRKEERGGGKAETKRKSLFKNVTNIEKIPYDNLFF